MSNLPSVIKALHTEAQLERYRAEKASDPLRASVHMQLAIELELQAIRAINRATKG
jgi:hypothetical protein